MLICIARKYGWQNFVQVVLAMVPDKSSISVRFTCETTPPCGGAAQQL